MPNIGIVTHRWIESFLNEKIDNNDDRETSIVQLEQTLHDGVVLAKLARRIHPGIITSITPGDAKFKFLRSNNINAFLTVLKEVGLPSIFWFEFVDLYDGKNMPKVIYCIHALRYSKITQIHNHSCLYIGFSHLLHSNDSAPKIKNLEGKFNFSEDVLVATQRNLEKSGAVMPNFNNLGSSLQKELDGGRKKPSYAFKKIEEPLLNNNDLEPKVRQFSKAAPLVTDLYDSDTESRASSSDELESPSIPTMQRLQFLGKQHVIKGNL